MVRTRIGAAAGAALAALGFALAPTSALAADGDLFSWGYVSGDPDIGGFVSVSPSDASLTSLGTMSIEPMRAPNGVEVCGGAGVAFGVVDDEPAVLMFDPLTGAITGAPVALSIPGGVVEGTVDADTLPDCTVLTVAQVTGVDEERETGLYVLRVDPMTGGTEPLVFLGDLYVTGIATAPDGKTYVGTFVPPSPAVVEVNLQTATVGTTTVLGGFVELYDDALGELAAMDFDIGGVLWAVGSVVDRDGFRLVSFAAGNLAAAPGTDHGQFPDAGSGLLVEPPIPLAVDATAPGAPAPGTQLAATGRDVTLGALVAGVVLSAVGVLAFVTSRRRSSAVRSAD